MKNPIIGFLLIISLLLLFISAFLYKYYTVMETTPDGVEKYCKKNAEQIIEYVKTHSIHDFELTEYSIKQTENEIEVQDKSDLEKLLHGTIEEKENVVLGIYVRWKPEQEKHGRIKSFQKINITDQEYCFSSQEGINKGIAKLDNGLSLHVISYSENVKDKSGNPVNITVLIDYNEYVLKKSE